MPAPEWSADACAPAGQSACDRRSNALDLIEIESVQRLDLGEFFLPSLLIAVATVVVGLTHRFLAHNIARLDSDHPFAVLDLATATMTVPYADTWVPGCAVVSAAGFAFACRGSRRMTAVGRVEARVWIAGMTLGAIAILPMAITIVVLMACVAVLAGAMAALVTVTTFMHHR